MVDEALGVPGRLGRPCQEGARLVEVADPEEDPAFPKERLERRGTAAGLRGKRGLDRRGLDERQGGRPRQVVGEPGRRGPDRDGRGRRDRDRLDLAAGALGHRVEGSDLLEVVAEEVEPVGLGRGHRVHVDDSSADRVGARGLADRLGVVVELPEELEEFSEGCRPAVRVSSRFENCSKAGTGCERAAGVVTTTSGADPGPDGAWRRDRSRERTASRSLAAAKAALMSRLSAIDSGKTRVSKGSDPLEERDVLGQPLGVPGLLGRYEPHRGRDGSGSRRRPPPPAGGGADPVSRWRRTGFPSAPGPPRTGSAIFAGAERGIRERRQGGRLLGQLLRGSPAPAERRAAKPDLDLVFPGVVGALGPHDLVGERVVAVDGLDQLLEPALGVLAVAQGREPGRESRRRGRGRPGGPPEVAVEEEGAQEGLEGVLEGRGPGSPAARFLAPAQPEPGLEPDLQGEPGERTRPG